jgi:endonuclease YncB( thermonuclease family)
MQHGLASSPKIAQSRFMSRYPTLSAILVAGFFLAGCAKDGEKRPAEAPRPETISGVGVAIDGDTVEVDGRIMDLWGVEAPNLDNSDGWFSRAALDDLIGPDGKLSCTVKVKTRRRTHAICTNSRVGDIGRAMLQGGWAIFARGDSKDERLDKALTGVYASAEARARRTRAGLWAGMPRR